MGGEWVFIIWFLLADGTIPQPVLKGPHGSWDLCTQKRAAWLAAPERPPQAVGHLVTSCTTRTALTAEAQSWPTIH